MQSFLILNCYTSMQNWGIMKAVTLIQKSFLLLLLVVLILSCREQEPVDPLAEEERLRKLIKEKIVEVMDDFYFWRENIPSGVNPANFSSYQALVDAMLYKPIDVWSYITSREEFDALTRQGTFAGHGYIQSIDAEGNLRVGAVFRGSPAEQAGFIRSTKILAINGQDAKQLIRTNSIAQAVGPREVGITNNFTIEQPDGTVRTVSVSKAIVTQNTVMHHQIFELSGKKIGYLVFMGFREPSIAELQPVFQQFQSANITDLILDLRYNGGGFVNVAEYMAGVIAPAAANGQILARYAFNERQRNREEIVRIPSGSIKLNLNNLIALTGPSTASASELLINGLSPFMNVKLVGERTGGKPVGAFVISIADQALVPITFKTVNSAGVGDYFDGMAVHKDAVDGLDRNWGDPEESKLKEAIYYIVNGNFRSEASARRTNPIYWQKNRMMLKGFQAEIGAF